MDKRNWLDLRGSSSLTWREITQSSQRYGNINRILPSQENMGQCSGPQGTLKSLGQSQGRIVWRKNWFGVSELGKAQRSPDKPSMAAGCWVFHLQHTSNQPRALMYTLIIAPDKAHTNARWRSNAQTLPQTHVQAKREQTHTYICTCGFIEAVCLVPWEGDIPLLYLLAPGNKELNNTLIGVRGCRK